MLSVKKTKDVINSNKMSETAIEEITTEEAQKGSTALEPITEEKTHMRLVREFKKVYEYLKKIADHAEDMDYKGINTDNIDPKGFRAIWHGGESAFGFELDDRIFMFGLPKSQIWTFTEEAKRPDPDFSGETTEEILDEFVITPEAVKKKVLQDDGRGKIIDFKKLDQADVRNLTDRISLSFQAWKKQQVPGI